MKRAESGSGRAGVTAISCLTHWGEKDRIAAGSPALTALTGVTQTPRPAAASWGAAAVIAVLITGSGRTPASANEIGRAHV